MYGICFPSLASSIKFLILAIKYFNKDTENMQLEVPSCLTFHCMQSATYVSSPTTWELTSVQMLHQYRC